MKRKLLFFALGILCMAFSATAVFLVVDRDRTGPVIAVPEDGTLTYTAGEDKRILLEGVTASDKKDGDVSDTLMVESIRLQEDENQAVVTYTAVDRSHNTSKASCVVNYVAEEEKETDSEEENQAEPETAEEELQENSETVPEEEEENTSEEKAQKAMEDAIAALPKGSPSSVFHSMK